MLNSINQIGHTNSPFERIVEVMKPANPQSLLLDSQQASDGVQISKEPHLPSLSNSFP